jgi:hypothetical protein
MKIILTTLLFCLSILVFGQNLKDYQAVIVPLRYDFMSADNQYRLATLTKANLLKFGFNAVYENQDYKAEYPERCQLLNVDVIKSSGVFTTNLTLVFKDCYDKVIYTSVTGKSREKDYELAYQEALNIAFESLKNIKHKPNAIQTPKKVAAELTNDIEAKSTMPPMIYYAQAIDNGFQLVDTTPKVIFKLMKTTIENVFMAFNPDQQGVILNKDNQWLFEYYKNDKLISEIIEIKF